MITIQRASAGSGKTFALARKFIYLFLTTTDTEGGPRRLRTPDELREAHSHILAITFTNKATDEMKVRIVEKLAALAADPATYAGKKRPDYMDIFTGPEFGATEAQVAALARRALSVLLAEYGDFNVTTIDSFFQNVLRTFAYETDLNDTYEVELDSDYITSVGIDNTLSNVNRGMAESDAAEWIALLMADPAYTSQWNIFQKKPTKAKYHSATAYGDLVAASSQMQREEFKDNRASFDAYFSTCGDYLSIFKTYDKHFADIFDAKYEAWTSACEQWQKCADAYPKLPDKNMISKLKANKACRKPNLPKYSYAKALKDGHILNDALRARPGGEELDAAAMKAFHALEELRQPSAEERLWTIYRPSLLLLGLLRTVRDNMHAFLDDNDIVELSETPLLLQRITHGSDTPFIYERLGTHLDHFLIDEFQDTSEMQWNNLEPLLAESTSKGGDNLIIGDPKQSIYRFRDAKVSLITKLVPEAFPDHTAAGHLPKDNTNHRSQRRIIEFNNSFFSTLAVDLEAAGAHGIRALYSNVVQPAHHTEDVGYIEWRFPTDTKQPETDIPDYFTSIPTLILDLRSRGFRFRDIALLVRRGEEGVQLVDTLMTHNSGAGDAGRIPFISEESLLIASSDAVRIVVSALQVIKRGAHKPTSPDTDHLPSTRAIDVRHAYSFFCSTHPGMDPAERLKQFMANPDHTMPLWEMLSRIQSPTLPAIVEAVIANYVPEAMREADAPFLAAFQDAVIDYCDLHSPDVGSFLAWWKAKKDSLSITSPANLDAVQILTIHKSKGLEFPCVILPRVKEDLSGESSARKDKVWIKPLPLCPDFPPLPPVINVPVAALAGTPHEDTYQKELDACIIDALNTLYVAFTRAATELYIFAPVPAKGAANSFATRAGAVLEEMRQAEAAPNLLPGSLIHSDPEGTVRIGAPKPYTPPADKESTLDAIAINAYEVSNALPVLYFSEQTAAPEPDADSTAETDETPAAVASGELPLEPPDEDDVDPRSEGNVSHKAMQWICTPEDTPKAVRRLYNAGFIRRHQMDAFEKMISDALSHPVAAQWFAPGLRVLAEQSVFRGPGKHRRADGTVAPATTRRPDRIVIDSAGNARIIDYKFGTVRKPRRYALQMGGYISRLERTKQFRSVEGYIWYVALGVVERVVRKQGGWQVQELQ